MAAQQSRQWIGSDSPMMISDLPGLLLSIKVLLPKAAETDTRRCSPRRDNRASLRVYRV